MLSSQDSKFKITGTPIKSTAVTLVFMGDTSNFTYKQANGTFVNLVNGQKVALSNFLGRIELSTDFEITLKGKNVAGAIKFLRLQIVSTNNPTTITYMGGRYCKKD